MKVIGFNFTKISAERNKKKSNEVKLDTEMDISDINKIKESPLKTKEEIIEVKFVYGVNYKPDLAKISLEGSIIFALESSMSKKILKEWKKKKIADEFKLAVFNVILKRSSLKALQIEEELNLPLHVPMPSFRKKE